MNNEQIETLINELCNETVKCKSYDGSTYDTTLIERNSKTILKNIIMQHVLTNRDEELAMLKAKVFVYEEVISKSNFAPMLIKEEINTETIKDETK